MKNIKFLFVLSLSVGFFACETKPVEPVSKEWSYSEIYPNIIPVEKPFSNPTLIYGSDFLNFLSALKTTNPGNLEVLLPFTSSESIKALGRAGVLKYYEKTNLIWKKQLKASKREGNMFYLSYVGVQMATKENVVVKVILENDTCKLIIP